MYNINNLKFDSILTGGRYPKEFSLPDYLRENGKFSREKTLREIVGEEYGEIDEKGVKISVKDVTDEKFDGNYGYFFCGRQHKGLPKTKAFSGRGEASRKVKPFFFKTAHKEA